MPKYYTVCLTTPAYREMSKTNQYAMVYRTPAMGFLFHDTEGIKDFQDVRKAVWVLSDLFVEGNVVWGVRVNAQTLMVSFSSDQIIHPVRVKPDRWRDDSYEWISKNKPTGWVVENIRDMRTKVHTIDFDDIYDSCGQLERMADSCPCPRVENGTCRTLTLYKEIPAIQDDITTYTHVEPEQLKAARYRVIDGYEYIPGQYTIEGAFVEAARPWDNYDFNLVEYRREEFKRRGQERSQRLKLRQERCGTCAFSHRKDEKPEAVLDCGKVVECKTRLPRALTHDDVYAFMKRWYHYSTPFSEDTDGFTQFQIRQLMYMAGDSFLSRFFTPTKRSETIFGGFYSDYFGIQYRIVAGNPGNAGDTKWFSTFADLEDAVRVYGDPDAIAKIERARDHWAPFMSEEAQVYHAVASRLTYYNTPHQPRNTVVAFFIQGYRGITVTGARGGKFKTVLQVGPEDYYAGAVPLFRVLWPDSHLNILDTLHPDSPLHSPILPIIPSSRHPSG
jgi:hypothetical protein